MSDSKENDKLRKELKETVLKHSRENKVVYVTLDGVVAYDLDEFVKQPAEGILYDLNRLPETALSRIDDPRWINDFAVSLVITKLKSMLDEKEKVETTWNLEEKDEQQKEK